MTSVSQIPQIFAAAGIPFVVESTWDLEPLGAFPIEDPKVVWHHDASQEGPSPGALEWIINAYRAGEAAAQLWVDTEGVWHLIGKGLAYHAGKNNGLANNHDSIGVETDHTVGETWPQKMLASLRKGTAALLNAFKHSAASGLFFHKQIAPDRKIDPDGLEITSERNTVAAIMAGPKTPSTPNGGTEPEEEMGLTPDQAKDLKFVADTLRQTVGVGQIADKGAPSPTAKTGFAKTIAAILENLQAIRLHLGIK